jgi:acetate---CoA ligase (ADP-forming)
MPVVNFDPLFNPRAIAVVGASTTSVAGGNRFLRHLKNFGFRGEVWPIHPKASEIEGFKAFSSFDSLPAAVDYAYVAVNARQVPEVIRSAKGKAKFIQVMSSGFSETDTGKALEQDLVAAAAESGVRVIGPNCLGTYSPSARLSFTAGTPEKIGRIGVISQSGGLGVDIVRRGGNRGLSFSSLVTVGNCADVKPAELLEYYFASDHVDVIGLYLETAMGGRQLFEVLRRNKGRKPVVLLKGGSTVAGQMAAISHTGALAGTQVAWEALQVQTGLMVTYTLNEFLDVLLLLQCFGGFPEKLDGVILFGNGGGTSVLGADAFARNGFRLSSLSQDTYRELQALNLPPGSSIANPIDVPAGALQQDSGRIAGHVLEALTKTPGALIAIHINLTVVLSFQHVDMLGNLIEAVLELRKGSRTAVNVILVLRSDGEFKNEQTKRSYRDKAVTAGIPVFEELSDAATALGITNRLGFAPVQVG